MAGRLNRLVWRVGSSLVVTIPKATVRRLGLHAGDLVGVSFTPVDVLVRAPDAAVRAMAELVAQVTPALMFLREMDGGHVEEQAWLSD